VLGPTFPNRIIESAELPRQVLSSGTRHKPVR
jgi:hypothetical protein